MSLIVQALAAPVLAQANAQSAAGMQLHKLAKHNFL